MRSFPERQRYARWIPVISHLLRLYQYPVVDPKGTPSDLRRALDEIGEEFGFPVFAIVTLDEVMEHLDGRAIDGKVPVDARMKSRIEVYREKYGAR